MTGKVDVVELPLELLAQALGKGSPLFPAIIFDDDLAAVPGAALDLLLEHRFFQVEIRQGIEIVPILCQGATFFIGKLRRPVDLCAYEQDAQVSLQRSATIVVARMNSGRDEEAPCQRRADADKAVARSVVQRLEGHREQIVRDVEAEVDTQQTFRSSDVFLQQSFAENAADEIVVQRHAGQLEMLAPSRDRADLLASRSLDGLEHAPSAETLGIDRQRI